MSLMSSLFGWFGWGGSALAERQGEQHAVPSVALVEDVAQIGADGALQIGAVWACIDRRASIVASLPFFAYQTSSDGQKTMARNSRLYQLLHESPNARMTPFDFWRAMIVNHDLRGNAYARIDRDERSGEAIGLWPMPADQVRTHVLDDGSMVYLYRLGPDLAALDESNVLHLRNLGNGTVGFDKLAFMRATTDEAGKAQTSASKMWGNSGKPTGVLMIDKVLRPDQRAVLNERFAEMSSGSTARLYVLEADMKYQQISMSPEQQQLLESRKFSIEEICRWFDVPPVLAHHSNVTTWGSAVYEIVDGFHKLTIRPLLINIEQAVRKRVMSPAQRASMGAEFSFDALLRGSPKDRAELYAKHVQNGVMTRNEVRQLENLPPQTGADALTAQSNLVPLALLGKTQPTGGSNAPAKDPVAQ